MPPGANGTRYEWACWDKLCRCAGDHAKTPGNGQGCSVGATRDLQTSSRELRRREMRQQRGSPTLQPWPLAWRSRGAPAHRHSLIPASPFISWCVCARRHYRRARPRASASGYRRLGPTGRHRKQAGRRHRPSGHRIRARFRPDGYTLLVTADATFVTSPHTTASCPMIRSTILSHHRPRHQPQALVVHPSLPVRTLGDLVNFAKQRPGELNYGNLWHRVERTPQHCPTGGDDRDQISRRCITAARRLRSPTSSAVTSR